MLYFFKTEIKKKRSGHDLTDNIFVLFGIYKNNESQEQCSLRSISFSIYGVCLNVCYASYCIKETDATIKLTGI